MFIVFLFLSAVCLAFICHNSGIYLLNTCLLFNGISWNILRVVDTTSICILLMLLLCFVLALYYTPHYFSGDNAGVELKNIICLFVAVMATLVLTGDFLRTLIFWEYLGVVSYFLILFYASYLSLRSSVVTLVSSRFGDVCLFVIIGVNLYTGKNRFVLCAVLFYFLIFTKRAGFPFISWLLEAMRAPTPVRSLVHSSTLVAAGVWFAMRYDIFYFYPNVSYMSVLLLITIFIRGTCCFFFIDLKKIIALSTCKNISWCVFYLLFGDVTLSLFQLVRHGVSKCLLFMLVGDVMSGSGGSQARNCVYSPKFYGNWGIFSLFSVILGLSGVPFIGVFFTKHFLLSTFRTALNYILLGAVLICVFISYFYSFRLCRILLNYKFRLVSGVLFSFGSGIIVFCWLLINFFVGGSLDETWRVKSNLSILLIAFQFISCLTAYFCYSRVYFSYWSSSLFGCDSIVEKFYRWFYGIQSWLGIFFFRWDNQLIGVFQGCGTNFISLFNKKLLNIITISIIIYIFFICVIV